jgi:type III secretory pathway lipoprotein EscJ
MGELKNINEVYEREYKKYSYYIPIAYDHSKIKRLIEKIAEVEYDNFAVELAPTNFKIKFIKSNWIFVINQPYESELLDGEIIMSIFRIDPRELFLSDVYSLFEINFENLFLNLK